MADRKGMGPTEVTIFGRTYHLRSDGDHQNLARLAAVVDGKMREVARSTDTADTTKVAIMAALNIADDCLRAQRAGRGAAPGDATDRLKRMVTLLDEALAD